VMNGQAKTTVPKVPALNVPLPSAGGMRWIQPQEFIQQYGGVAAPLISAPAATAVLTPGLPSPTAALPEPLPTSVPHKPPSGPPRAAVTGKPAAAIASEAEGKGSQIGRLDLSAVMPGNPEALAELWVRKDGSVYEYFPNTKRILEVSPAGAVPGAEQRSQGPFGAAPPVAPTPAPEALAEARIKKLQADPVGAMTFLEKKMADNRESPARMQQFRAYLARDLTDAGVMDTGTAMAYVAKGPTADVGNMLSQVQQAQQRALGTQERFEAAQQFATWQELMRAQRVGNIPVSFLKPMLDAARTQAKQERKRALVVTLPNGQVAVEVINKPGWKLIPTELLYTKRGVIESVKQELEAGIKPDDVAFVDLSAGRTTIQGEPAFGASQTGGPASASGLAKSWIKEKQRK